MADPKTHGGKREGAGRKGTGRTTIISANVKPETAAEIKRQAKAKGSIGKLLDAKFRTRKTPDQPK